MFNFEKLDEGFMVTDESGRAVCTVDCGRAGWDERMKAPTKIIDKWESENWIIHFTGYRFKPMTLATLLSELAKQKF